MDCCEQIIDCACIDEICTFVPETNMFPYRRRLRYKPPVNRIYGYLPNDIDENDLSDAAGVFGEYRKLFKEHESKLKFSSFFNHMREISNGRKQNTKKALSKTNEKKLSSSKKSSLKTNDKKLSLSSSKKPSSKTNDGKSLMSKKLSSKTNDRKLSLPSSKKLSSKTNDRKLSLSKKPSSKTNDQKLSTKKLETETVKKPSVKFEVDKTKDKTEEESEKTKINQFEVRLIPTGAADHISKINTKSAQKKNRKRYLSLLSKSHEKLDEIRNNVSYEKSMHKEKHWIVEGKSFTVLKRNLFSNGIRNKRNVCTPIFLRFKRIPLNKRLDRHSLSMVPQSNDAKFSEEYAVMLNDGSFQPVNVKIVSWPLFGSRKTSLDDELTSSLTKNNFNTQLSTRKSFNVEECLVSPNTFFKMPYAANVTKFAEINDGLEYIVYDPPLDTLQISWNDFIDVIISMFSSCRMSKKEKVSYEKDVATLNDWKEISESRKNEFGMKIVDNDSVRKCLKKMAASRCFSPLNPSALYKEKDQVIEKDFRARQSIQAPNKNISHNIVVSSVDVVRREYSIDLKFLKASKNPAFSSPHNVSDIDYHEIYKRHSYPEIRCTTKQQCKRNAKFISCKTEGTKELEILNALMSLVQSLDEKLSVTIDFIVHNYVNNYKTTASIQESKRNSLSDRSLEKFIDNGIIKAKERTKCREKDEFVRIPMIVVDDNAKIFSFYFDASVEIIKALKLGKVDESPQAEIAILAKYLAKMLRIDKQNENEKYVESNISLRDEKGITNHLSSTPEIFVSTLFHEAKSSDKNDASLTPTIKYGDVGDQSYRTLFYNDKFYCDEKPNVNFKPCQQGLKNLRNFEPADVLERKTTLSRTHILVEAIQEASYKVKSVHERKRRSRIWLVRDLFSDAALCKRKKTAENITLKGRQAAVDVPKVQSTAILLELNKNKPEFESVATDDGIDLVGNFRIKIQTIRYERTSKSTKKLGCHRCLKKAILIRREILPEKEIRDVGDIKYDLSEISN